MTIRLGVILVATVCAVGCSPPAREPGAKKAPTAVASQSSAPEPSINKTTTGSVSRKTSSMAVGAVSFTPPANWVPHEAFGARGISLMAPKRPEWHTLGFRPNLGVRMRPHPGMTVERYREHLEETLARSYEEVNAVIAKYQEAARGQLPKISFEGEAKYSVTIEDLDDVPALYTTFTGVFELPNGPAAIKTYGVEILTLDALYTITMTFPVQFNDEMTRIWTAFVGNVVIDK